MQPENVGNNADLAKYRMERANEDLHAAEVLVNAREYRSANNRAYYAVFHAILAVHALNGESYRRHKDAIWRLWPDFLRWRV
ncbi:MAG: HEPN domain-containing protein [Lachnospiraceae bacterium]|jgi:uncharacterized protein (UPF0332 family)|nr:HEPN domain-containing protein [Lachnospiraceae bacterium]